MNRQSVPSIERFFARCGQGQGFRSATGHRGGGNLNTLGEFENLAEMVNGGVRRGGNSGGDRARGLGGAVLK